MELLYSYWWVLIILLFVFSGLVTVNQGYINVLTMFGKYKRISAWAQFQDTLPGAGL